MNSMRNYFHTTTYFLFNVYYGVYLHRSLWSLTIEMMKLCFENNLILSFKPIYHCCCEVQHENNNSKYWPTKTQSQVSSKISNQVWHIIGKIVLSLLDLRSLQLNVNLRNPILLPSSVLLMLLIQVEL